MYIRADDITEHSANMNHDVCDQIQIIVKTVGFFAIILSLGAVTARTLFGSVVVFSQKIQRVSLQI